MRRKQAMEETNGKYTIIDTLGKCGMDEVYLSLDLALSRNIAIKKLLIKEDAVFSKEERREILSQS
jgi:serine/threonine protein kinase